MDRICVTVNNTEVILHFGMTSKNIWQTKCAEEVIRLGKGNQKQLAAKVDNTRAFAFLIYAGICNYQDMQENPKRPTFEEAYLIADEIMQSDELTKDVWSCWENSKANKALIATLQELTGKPQKKSEKIS